MVTIVACGLTLAGCTVPRAPGFLTSQGTHLMLGGAPYHFTGLNIYNASAINTCWYSMGSGSLLDDSLTAIDGSTGGTAKVFRTFYFQHMAIANGVRDWSGFDHTLAVAKAHGFKVIPTLGNQWGDCESPGGYKTESWYQSGYLATDPSGIESYHDWVRDVVARYRDDPTIAMWMLINEAEDGSVNRRSCSATASVTLRSFVDDMGALVKGIDHNHLLTLGTLGQGNCGTVYTDYQSVYASTYVDVCEYHDYNSPTIPMPGDQWNGLQKRIDQCAALNKPIIVGEAGIASYESSSTAQRATMFDAKMTAQFAAGISGFMPWEWRAPGQPGGDAYVIDPGDPLLAVLGTHGMASP